MARMLTQFIRGMHSCGNNNKKWQTSTGYWLLLFVIGIGLPSLGLVAVSEARNKGGMESSASLRLFHESDRRHMVHRIVHHPAGPTMYHDYYAAKTDPGIAKLVRLVESAHVSRIVPLIKQSFKIHENFRKSRLRSALAEVKYTLERLVNHPKALALSATVGTLLGQPDLPVEFYQRAITMYPKRAMTHAQYGNFLVGSGELEAGIERLQIATKVNPKLAVAYGWLALAYAKNNQPRLAEEYVQKAKEKGFRGKLPTLGGQK